MCAKAALLCSSWCRERPGRDQSRSQQQGCSAVHRDEKPAEREGQPKAGLGVGGRRQPEGPAHLGEWTVGYGAVPRANHTPRRTLPTGSPTPAASQDAPSGLLPEVWVRTARLMQGEWPGGPRAHAPAGRSLSFPQPGRLPGAPHGPARQPARAWVRGCKWRRGCRKARPSLAGQGLGEHRGRARCSLRQRGRGLGNARREPGQGQTSGLLSPLSLQLL